MSMKELYVPNKETSPTPRANWSTSGCLLNDVSKSLNARTLSSSSITSVIPVLHPSELLVKMLQLNLKQRNELLTDYV